jgi:hypothetical protein
MRKLREIGLTMSKTREELVADVTGTALPPTQLRPDRK